MTDESEKRSYQGVLVAVFETNLIGTDEAITQTVRAFDMDDFEGFPGSSHEFVRPYLEDEFGMVENLKVHPTHIQTIDNG